MKKIGLSGNIGSGKSVVAKIFNTIGIPVFNADEMAKAVLNEPDILRELRTYFGEEIIDKEGAANRKKLAGIVFTEPRALEFLNGLIHPEVHKSWLKWMTSFENEAYVVHEAAILFESGFASLLDDIIVVTAPIELRKQRVMARDGVSEADFYKRVQHQWPEEKIVNLARYSIDNSGRLALIPQVLELDKMLRQ